MEATNHTRTVVCSSSSTGNIGGSFVGSGEDEISDNDLLRLVEGHESSHTNTIAPKQISMQRPQQRPQQVLQSRHRQEQQQDRTRKLACLYTSQKLKKKKTFHDGTLKLNVETGFVSLHKEATSSGGSLGSVLDTRAMTRGEVGELLTGALSEIEFEGYLVQVDEVEEEAKSNENARSVSNHSIASCASVPRGRLEPPPMKKFKAPSQVVPKIPSVPEPFVPSLTDAVGSGRGLHNNPIIRNTTGKRAYDVDDDELDAIWGSGEEDDGREERERGLLCEQKTLSSCLPSSSAQKGDENRAESSWGSHANDYRDGDYIEKTDVHESSTRQALFAAGNGLSLEIQAGAAAAVAESSSAWPKIDHAQNSNIWGDSDSD